jgi:predicted Rossmann fold nucleotide-binding protein DprA/Smf involved in DNA uptake
MLQSETLIDDLSRQLTLPISQVSAVLVKLEIGGFVTNLGNGNFIKN